jgi:penicillin-binding protein 2
MRFSFRKRNFSHEIAPEEIFLDSSNLPDLDALNFEGKVERPVSRRAVFLVGAFFCIVAGLFATRATQLEAAQGSTFAEISRDNVLQSSIQFATRGLIYDRNGKELAWNELLAPTSDASSSEQYALRKYTTLPGLSHLLGWVRYPKQDKSGAWWREEYSGMSGLELAYESALAGQNGSTMVESDARGRLQRENIVSPPENGDDLHLSIDAEVQSQLYQILSQHAKDMGFVGGAGVIMDVRTGELLALTSFPEYDHQAFTDQDATAVANASNDLAKPLLNRAISGLYAPGSIVKPIFAAAALNEGIITPDTIIVSTGAISIPNPYDPEHPSLFHDWAVHGAIDMRTALAVSSDEYFYTIGGGYGAQKGLGIDRIDKYAKIFGLSEPTGIDLVGEQDGVVPTPVWKAATFGADDPWRIGDTYHTAIGQYGFQITPIQAARFIAAVANGGKLFTPSLLASSTPQFTQINIPDTDLEVVREGMRMAVSSDRFDATVKALNIYGIKIAAKTGTAQIGTHNQYMNSWSVGFWPADNPKYAYAVVLEKAPAGTASGAAPGLVPFFEWLIMNHPEYVN